MIPIGFFMPKKCPSLKQAFVMKMFVPVEPNGDQRNEGEGDCGTDSGVCSHKKVQDLSSGEAEISGWTSVFPGHLVHDVDGPVKKILGVKQDRSETIVESGRSSFRVSTSSLTSTAPLLILRGVFFNLESAEHIGSSNSILYSL